MSNPSPSHGLKNLYSEDFSKWTWLFRMTSTSSGSTRNTTSLVPIQIRAIVEYFFAIFKQNDINSKTKKSQFNNSFRENFASESVFKI